MLHLWHPLLKKERFMSYNLNDQVQEVFIQSIKEFAQKDVLFVMPAFYPQRGGILQDIVKNGGKAIIAGGAPNQQLFEGITQYSPGYDTTGIPETPKEIYEIVKSIPSELVKGKDVALFVEAPVGKHWSNNLKLKKANIISSNEQNLRLFFEEKTNLEEVLKQAGLDKCFIPSEVIDAETLDVNLLEDLYQKYQGHKGKVVLQACGAQNFESGGGKGTSIVSTFDEFAESILEHKGSVKVAKYINGVSSNMSMFVGNTIPVQNGHGVVKGELSSKLDAFNPKTLNILTHKGKELGIDEEKVVVLAARASLKAIGDKNLTKNNSNGVGNSLGYEFGADIDVKVLEIAQKLGTLMAKCGKVGLCGADLIIDDSNNIFINEVNDRQQGPTEQLSLDAEHAGLVGIHRLAFISNYADCSSSKAQLMFKKIQHNSATLYNQSLANDGTFYIKMMGKQAGTATSEIDLKPGIYAVEKSKYGTWIWDFSKNYETAENIDLSKNNIYIGLAGVSLKKGQKVPSGSQILRIVGKAKNGSTPFNIEEGKVILNKKWLPIVNSLYTSMFGKSYNKQIETVKGNNSGRV